MKPLRLYPLFINLFVLLFVPYSLQAQTNFQRDIFGLVFDVTTGEPLEAANVFIANSMMGDASNEEGYFLISGVPHGTFEIVASVIGYEVEKRRIQVDDSTDEIIFRLNPKAIEAPEIEVTAAAMQRWRKNLEKFTELFMGTSRNARECTILNPEVLEFDEGGGAQSFRASTSEALQIENRALGYHIDLILESFTSSAGEVKYSVYTKFTELPPKDTQQKERWSDNKQRTYNGSMRHFLKSLYYNRVAEEGFLLRNLTTPSFNETARVLEKPTRATLLSETAVAAVKRFHFVEVLEVTYVPELEEEGYIDFRLQHDFTLVKSNQDIRTRAKEALNQASWLQLKGHSVDIDKFGHIDEPLAVTVNGYWGWERIAEMLPWEYEGYIRNRPDVIVLDMGGDDTLRKRHLTISAFLGFSSSGPAGDVENLMRTGGYDQVSDRIYPFSVTGFDTESGASWVIEGHYSIGWTLGAGIVRSDIKMGATHGRQLSDEIDINYSVSSWAIVVTSQPIKLFRFGFGPAWHTPKSGSSRISLVNNAPKQTKFGFLSDFTLLLPITPSFQGALKAQYRNTGSAELGPYRRFGSLLTDDLPATFANYNHWFFGLGFGFGF